MDKITTFLIEIVCPECGRSGTAHASSRELSSGGQPQVSLDQVPYGFSLATGSGTELTCECGTKFSPSKEHYKNN